jgi:pimeloyl-ACP methyl ester carboxylesterase
MFTRFCKLFSVVLLPTVVLMFLFPAPLLLSQNADKPEERHTVKEKSKKESPKKGQMQDLESELLTQDGVRLAATYYYGNADKKTVPVLLLHGDKGSRKDFAPLIDLLANNGYAVLVADLRGHGKSTKRFPHPVPKQQYPGNAGRSLNIPMVDYLAEEFQPEDYVKMAKFDLPLLRETLERVHVEGMVNLYRLVVVGVGRGAALAAYWAAQDWKDKDSDRFTKTLVMIAPTELDPRFDMPKTFSNNKWMRTHLAVLFAVPNNDTISQGIAEKIRAALLEKNEEEKLEANFQIVNYPTTKAGKKDNNEPKTEMTITEIFTNSETKLGSTVFNFIDRRNKVFTEKEARWSKLK